MKKVVSLLLCICLCIGCVITLSSCSFKHPVEALREKLENSNNFQMKMTIKDVPLLGDVKSTVQVDGNKQHYSALMLESEYYTETIDDVKYKYTQNSKGQWFKAVMEEDDDEDDPAIGSTLKDVLIKDHFEKVDKNTYRQKAEVEFEHFSRMTITVSDDIYTIETMMEANRVNVNCTLEFSHFGEIKITLPELG